MIQRVGRDRVHSRIVWRGREVTECEIPIAVHALTALSSGQELERRIVALHTAGKSDAAIAQELTAAGLRSPKGFVVLPSTVQIVRLKQRLFVTRHQSHPRQVSGFLTVPQLTRTLGVPSPWLYDRINKGRIHLQKDPVSGRYLFPDHPSTLEQLAQLRDGHLHHLGFGKEYQDA